MLKIFNSLTCKIEGFKPAKDMKVKMYTCGPSTYQRAHIGNFRTFLFEDIFQRYMEYQGYKVERLMTLTDIEDKAILQAKKEKVTVEELTAKNEDVFFKDFELLRIKKPTYPIRASKAVDQSVKLISKLLENGYAYWYSYKSKKNAYYDPLKFSGFGKLAHLDITKWPKQKRHFHLDTYPGTPWNKGDFVLWHGCNREDFCYDTTIGRGRPAWNIQDAAIVTKQMGFSIDVACGGIDNLVRHHDYTLAVAEACSGKQFSRYWLHGGHLFVDGAKMSKSKGNVLYTSDVSTQGFSGDQLRFFLIYGCYRKKLNFTYERIAETSQMLDSFRKMISEITEIKATDENAKHEETTKKIKVDFERNMNNDLDVKSAFDCLNTTVNELYKTRETLSVKDIKNVFEALHRVDSVLNFIF